MKKRNIKINNIPAILWGEDSNKLFIAVHGNMSCKDDEVIRVLAEEIYKKGYMVLSFDLPKHGDRKEEDYKLNIQNAISDLTQVYNYAKKISKEISLFACSLGAYFSLISYKDFSINQSVFLSPVVDMKKIIENMMKAFNVSEKRLEDEYEIETPIGETLNFDYYNFVKENPIQKWESKTSILYGSNDEICDINTVLNFKEKFNCNIKVLEDGEHFFHTKSQIEFYKNWIKECIV